MMTAELVSNPMHVGTVLMLSPPADAGPAYVEELYGEGARRKRIDRSQALRVIRIAV